jgi:hypothetical protein
MNPTAQAELEQEPIGIVISSGSREESAPRFTAFMWSPVPDEPELAASGSTRAA